MKANEFLLTPGPLPWRLDCLKRNAKSGVVYAADGRLVCVAAIGNAREIVRMANLFYTAPRRGVPEAQKPPRQEGKPTPANS
jgi:hypothetical protein